MAQVQREVPRWRQKRPPAGPAVTLSGRGAKKFAREVGRSVAAAPPLTGQVIPPHRPVPGSKAMARTGAFRFRMHLIPFGWLAAVLATGMAAHLAHAVSFAVITGLVAAVSIVLLCRHLSAFARKAALALASLTALWLPLLASLGFSRPWPALLAVCWLCVLVPWVLRYRWRHEATQVHADVSDAAIWARLAAKNKWAGHLDLCDTPAPGVRQYRILLDGAETHMGQVMAEPRRIAAAWGKSIAEAYAEPSPEGIESRGLLTILPRNTLEKAREWDGSGIDPETGMAVVGRFPDGTPVHERYLIRRNGVRHSVIAGADGSGKTALLSLGLSLSATSGFIAPVILDPQEGQALPAWKEHVPYACGVDECMAFLRGLHDALFGRSRQLAGFRWEADDGTSRTGLDFFDPVLTGLPVVEVTLDETPALLTHPRHGPKALALLADIGKLGRKAGFRLRLAIQVPSLSEFGGNAQALRSMLAGGNVFCGRTGDKVSGGMIGIAAEPSQLPKYFADGSPTVGLGYASGPDNRPATPMRWDWVPDPYKVARSAKIRELDERVAAALERARKAGGVQLPLPSASPSLAAVPPPDDDGPEGRTCSDAVLAVLTGEMTRGEIIAAVKNLTEGAWGRPRTFSTKAVQNALTAMAGDGRISKPRDGTYAPSRPSLHAVAPTSPGSR